MVAHTLIASPGEHLRGRLRVPGDKSISHRALMLGAIADGDTLVEGFLPSEDTLATLAAFRSMGVHIEQSDSRATIHGVGRAGLKQAAGPLFLGNSGTSMRLLAGLLCGQPFDVELQGDPSLSRRPMRRITEPLAQMGGVVETTADGTPPLRIRGNARLHGIDYRLPVASAQVKSCLLLAGLYASGRTRLHEPGVSRDHTERMLGRFGCRLSADGEWLVLEGGGTLQATAVTVPGDISSAAFFLVGASIAEGSDIVIENVGINPSRIGVLNILKMMGADIRVLRAREAGGEPVADLRVRSAPLSGIRIPPAQVPLAIDEFPAIFIAAACARGETVLTGAAELRVKESDRIASMAAGLQALGIDVRVAADGIAIRGGTLRGGRIDSRGDHRVAMAFAVAALKANGEIRLDDCRNIKTS